MTPPSNSNSLLFVSTSFFLLAVFVSGESAVGITFVGGAAPSPTCSRPSPVSPESPSLTQAPASSAPSPTPAFPASAPSPTPSSWPSPPKTPTPRSDHITPFHPCARVAAVSLGREVLSSSNPNLSASFLPALGNLHVALGMLGFCPPSTPSTSSRTTSPLLIHLKYNSHRVHVLYKHHADISAIITQTIDMRQSNKTTNVMFIFMSGVMRYTVVGNHIDYCKKIVSS